MSRIQLVTEIAAPRDLCFDLALNVDVQLSLDGEMQAIGGVTSGALALADLVTWRARHFGVRWRMTSKIVTVERPDRFVDKMQEGPFSRWRHQHDFEPSADGTRMRDTVEYVAPLGPLGQAFDALVLNRYLIRLLRKRNRVLRRTAEERAAHYER